jgi:chorismate mutase
MSTTISPAHSSGIRTDAAVPGAVGVATPLAATGELPATDLRSAGEADLIPLLRTQIDAIDAGIARLVAERARLSTRIQAARIAAGGVRVELGRERLVLDGYRSTLGEEGVALGNAVLRLCRGPIQ